MKRFVSQLGLFLSFAAAFYVVMILLYGALIPASLAKNFKYFDSAGFTRIRLAEAGKSKNVDLVIIGSSHAYRGYDPRIFKKAGVSAFNLGSSSQTPLQTRYLVRKYFKNLKPKFVIVDVYPLLFGANGLESQIDLISSGLMDKEIIGMSFDINDMTLYNTTIFGIFNNTFHLAKQKKAVERADTYIPGGYVESYRKLKLIPARAPQKIQISPVQLAAFQETVAYLKSNHIKYIIVQAPFSRSNYNSYLNNDEIDRLFSNMGEYYNFNKILNLPNSMYFDDSHLNQTGVNIYNAALIRMIKAKGALSNILVNN